MNPLSTFKYTKSNFNKSLPIIISMVVGVFLIYFSSLITQSTVQLTDLCFTNFSSKYAKLSSNSEEPIKKDYLDRISRDTNVDHMVPLLKANGYLQYSSVFGVMSMDVLNLYQQDISKVISTINVKLVEGNIPSENRSEVIIPKKYALQNGLKVGDFIGSDVSSSSSLKGKYKISGITDGPVMVTIISDNKQNIPRDKAMNYSILFSIKNIKDKSLIEYLSHNSGKNIIMEDYYSNLEQVNDMLSIMNTFSYSLTAIIIFVMGISLGNLNYISFLNRKYEFGVLSAIGYKKTSLYFKLWKETSFICLLGYVGGILLSILIAFLLNKAVFEPNGKFIPIWNTYEALIAFATPVFVSFLSLILPIKELTKTDPVDIIGGVI